MNGINAAITEIDVLTSAVADAMAEVCLFVGREEIDYEKSDYARRLVSFIVGRTAAVREKLTEMLDVITNGWNDVIQNDLLKAQVNEYLKLGERFAEKADRLDVAVCDTPHDVFALVGESWFARQLLQILEKYNYSVPRLTDQKINEYIKEVAKMAGLTEEIRVEYVQGGRKHIDFVPKWKMVHSHTARRTGATLMYLSGMEIYDIMKITGHTSPLMLKRYIKADELEVVQKIVEKYNYFD